MCTKGYSHIIRTDKSQPSSATPKKKKRKEKKKEEHLAMREGRIKKEQSEKITRASKSLYSN